MPVKLFAGLGNPGEKYQNTRHNFGFKAVSAIAESFSANWKKFENVADVATGGKVSFIKPLMFMNLSGEPLAAFMKYYKITPAEILVFYDDFSIPLGSWRVRLTGSAGGHNGVSSIINSLGTQNFARVKLGIGPLPEKMPTANFVLSNFLTGDEPAVNKVLSSCVELCKEITENGLEKAVSRVVPPVLNI